MISIILWFGGRRKDGGKDGIKGGGSAGEAWRMKEGMSGSWD